MSDLNGAATGSVAENYKDPKAGLTEADALLAAVVEAAANYERKYGLPPNTVRLPKHTSQEAVAGIMEQGFVVEAQDQSPRHVQTLYRWPHSGQWQEVKRKTKSHVSRLMWYSNTAYVEFDDGSYYAYQGIDQITFRKLSTAESVGGYLNLNIKEKHPYYRLEEKEIELVKDGLTTEVKKLLDMSATLNKTPEEIEATNSIPVTTSAAKEAPGVYVKIDTEDGDYADAIHHALAKGVKKLAKKGYDPNDIALPANAPGEVVKFYLDNGVRVASWTPSRPNEVWVGVLP